MPAESLRPHVLTLAAFALCLALAGGGVELWRGSGPGWLTGSVLAGPVGAAAQHVGEKGPANRLAQESSPYLRLHAHNPVDWYPWGEEALDKAKRENKPIFLSVGYSTCYWCHVMERESFSDPEIAAFLNEHFVAVKVDREERPDLDEIYMLATQLMTRRGGWPNSVFLTPALEPFYAGTYFPPEDRQRMTGFRTLIDAIHQSWTTEQASVKAHAAQLAATMKRVLEPSTVAGAVELPGRGPAIAGLENLASRFDAERGGFGKAPKFPSPSNLFLLLDVATPEADRMLEVTLDHMARGGLYDQVGGGFHRYSTDAEWRVPHFEKMLYDNGALLEVYGRWFEKTKDPQAARVLRQTAAFLEREMSSPDGALLSAIDAETNAREGAFYVWTEAELEATLSEQERAFAGPLLGFAGEAGFRDPHGSPEEAAAHVLHLPKTLAAQAMARDLELVELRRRLEPVRGKLLAEREKRERPLTDDKVMADWNGLGIAGLAAAGRVLGERAIVEQARRAAAETLRRLRKEGGPLRHVWRAEGGARLDAFLADYAYLVHGLLALEQATGERRWLERAAELTEEQIERLWDASSGGFFVAAPDPDLITRSKDAGDGARPSANGVSLLNLLTLYERTGEARWLERATEGLRAFAPQLERAPAGHMTLARAAARFADLTSGSSAVARLETEARSKVSATARFTGAAKVGWRPFEVRLHIAEGWHINAHPASDEFLVATEVSAADGQVRHLRYPEGKPLQTRWSESTVAVYEGESVITGELFDEQRLELRFQACDAERCLPASDVVLDVED